MGGDEVMSDYVDEEREIPRFWASRVSCDRPDIELVAPKSWKEMDIDAWEVWLCPCVRACVRAPCSCAEPLTALCDFSVG